VIVHPLHEHGVEAGLVETDLEVPVRLGVGGLHLRGRPPPCRRRRRTSAWRWKPGALPRAARAR
jgi:hypothetical protein